MNLKSLLKTLAFAMCLLCTIDAAAQEAYATFHESDYSLTFYYDNYRSSHLEPTYDLNTGSNAPGWFDDGTRNYIEKVVFTQSFADARPTSTYAWFLQMIDLESITGMEYLNTSQVTDMSYMFYGCEKLTSLDLSTFNTANVTNMYGMFYGCKSLRGIDLSSFDTDQVTNMTEMFTRCQQLTTLDLSSFSTANVEQTRFMFLECNNLTTIYVDSTWDITSVSDTDAYRMFINCYKLVGGMGTAYDSAHINGEYARIDGGPDAPGYLSLKPNILRGDVNGDGEVKINDVTALIGYLLSGASTGINPASADMDEDSRVTISDVTALIGYLLSGSQN